MWRICEGHSALKQGRQNAHPRQCAANRGSFTLHLVIVWPCQSRRIILSIGGLAAPQRGVEPLRIAHLPLDAVLTDGAITGIVLKENYSSGPSKEMLEKTALGLKELTCSLRAILVCCSMSAAHLPITS
jgi:hypothetical protein